ncbi:hypothetical protein BRYFOR_07478 [Marvinbryantia formatexigens DSM 14469]|uniref:Uncharacterized protein n=1 Tax=Marvinbryantia formatexigens DSM 14469 TaxID=478749 RepID=C6LFR8_9FIRM|nr:hypothetical protein BRYFOR_07478 [Marvinbryantia formatexigens DSM 14469]
MAKWNIKRSVSGRPGHWDYRTSAEITEESRRDGRRNDNRSGL